jgi:hypothetical protein
VLSVESWSGPRVSEGLLGCPVCDARYPIHHGVADFTGGMKVVRRPDTGSPPDAMRLAAQLSLAEPGGIILLAGRQASSAEELAAITDVTCLVVSSAPSSSPAVVSLEVGDRLPLADHLLRGAAVDEQHGGPEFLIEIARCVRGSGRIVAPAGSAIPHGTVLLARDEREWVGEVEASTAPVQLRRVPSA